MPKSTMQNENMGKRPLFPLPILPHWGRGDWDLEALPKIQFDMQNITIYSTMLQICQVHITIANKISSIWL